MGRFEIYLLLKLDGIVALLCLFECCSFVILIALGWVRFWDFDDYSQELMQKIDKTVKCALIVALVSSAGVAVIPTTKQAIAIWVAPKIINSSQLDQLDNVSKELLGINGSSLK